MTLLKKAKENLFSIFIIVAYIAMFLIRQDLAITSVKNSAYYIKEMIIIMPVIFVLTALLDLWVPKEKIMKFLGKESKSKGVILSIVLGSISAGPVYAAFPLCAMLHKKGASIRNLVIILSAWAVIKVPMLLNEMKFLGFKFMAVRWALTIIAILAFSWLTAKFVKDSDIPKTSEKEAGVTINQSACMGCTLCTKKYPELFEMKSKKAVVKPIDGEIDKEKLKATINACPVKAIVHTK